MSWFWLLYQLLFKYSFYVDLACLFNVHSFLKKICPLMCTLSFSIIIFWTSMFSFFLFYMFCFCFLLFFVILLAEVCKWWKHFLCAHCLVAMPSTFSLKLFMILLQMITLGGDAELELVDSLDPFSEGVVFSVRPPKKSWKNIANLSGGEKVFISTRTRYLLGSTAAFTLT